MLINTVISDVLFLGGFIATLAGLNIDTAAGTAVKNKPLLIFGLLIILAYLIFKLATFIPTITLSIRRIRDAGLSPWWYLLRIISSGGSYIFYSNLFYATFKGNILPNLSTTVSVIAALVLFIMYLLPTKRPNVANNVAEPDAADLPKPESEQKEN